MNILFYVYLVLIPRKGKVFYCIILCVPPSRLDEMSFIKSYEKLVLYLMASRFLEKLNHFTSLAPDFKKLIRQAVSHIIST